MSFFGLRSSVPKDTADHNDGVSKGKRTRPSHLIPPRNTNAPEHSAAPLRTFILENATSHFSIYYATKSLPLHYIHHPLHDMLNQTPSSASNAPPRRHVLAGPNAWNNLVRYELPNNDYVHAEILPSRCPVALLFVEFRNERIVTQTATAVEPSSPAKPQSALTSTIKHAAPTHPPEDASLPDPLLDNAHSSPTTTTTPQQERATTHSSPSEERIFRSYWIELEPHSDIILRASVEKTIFGKKRFVVEPVGAWFSSTYTPPRSLTPISLKHNITKRQFIPVVKTAADKAHSIPTQSEHKPLPHIPMPSTTRIPPTSNSSPDSAMSVCEDETLDLLRENIVTHLSFLHRMKRCLRLLVIRDKKQRHFDPVHYLMQHVLRLNTPSIRNWFQSSIRLYEIEPHTLHNYLIIPMRFSRCLNVYNRRAWEQSSVQTEIDPIYTNIAGIIMLPRVSTGIPSSISPILQQLEGFPLLFMLHGLLECSTIYDALQKKERVEMDIVRIFSSTHKPLIVSCIEKKTETENITTCIFLREAIDAQVEKLVADAPIDETTHHMQKIECLVSGLLVDRKDQEGSCTSSDDGDSLGPMSAGTVMGSIGGTDSEDSFLHTANVSTSNFFFYSLDNEHESVEAALDAMPATLLSTHEIFVYTASREQFNNNARLLFSGNNAGRRQIAEHLSTTIRRNMSTLWNLGQSSDDEFQEEDILESRIRKVKSSTQLSTLDSGNMSRVGSGNLHSRTSSEERFITTHHTLIKTLSGKVSHHPIPPPPENLFLMDQISDNSFTQTQKTLESSIINESEELHNVQNSFSVTPTKSMLSVSSSDIVVLCVELSGRVLIHGENGIFTSFLHEARQHTSNIVLFVDRRDRDNSTIDQKERNYTIVEEGTSIMCGDSIDQALDQELKLTQGVHEVCRYRCYHSSSNTSVDNEMIREFWSRVVQNGS